VGPNQILGARAITLSPDGKTLYVVSATRQAVTIYSRDTTTGDLTPLPPPGDCVKEGGGTGCERGVAMIHPVSITVRSDGETAYVSGQQSHSIAIFDRDPATGELTQKPGTAGCISEGGLSDPMQAGTQGACLSGVAMRGISSVAILPDGSALYAAAQNSSGLDVFARAPDGTIAQRPGTAGCITETGYENPSLPWTAGACAQASPLQSANDVIASSDGEHVYTAAPTGNGGVGIFDVVGEPPPAGPPPPSPPPGKGRAAECAQALASLREAQRHIKLAESAIHRQRRARKKAKGVRAKQNLRQAIRRNRRQIKRWSQSAGSAHQEISASCANG
jgi:DNA-binding beta-propeller fold protein YncE